MIVWLTAKDSKQARTALGATHFCPPMAAHGSTARGTAEAAATTTREDRASSMVQDTRFPSQDLAAFKGLLGLGKDVRRKYRARKARYSPQVSEATWKHFEVSYRVLYGFLTTGNRIHLYRQSEQDNGHAKERGKEQ